MKILTTQLQNGDDVSINCDMISHVQPWVGPCTLVMLAHRPIELIIKMDYLSVIGFLKADT